MPNSTWLPEKRWRKYRNNGSYKKWSQKQPSHYFGFAGQMVINTFHLPR